MTDMSNATIRQLWVRMWRIRLARWAMWTCRAFADLAEWLMPEDLRHRLSGIRLPQLAGFDLLFAGAETPRPWM